MVKGKSIFENAAEFQKQLVVLGPVLDGGANPGVSGQVLVSTGVNVEWVDNVVVNQPTFTKVLEGSSFADQLPTGQNTPLQIEFGANQQTPEVNLLPTGEVNFLVDGTYFFEAFGNVERNGNSGGVAMVMYRILLNGMQLGITRGVDINSVGIMIPLSISEPINVSAGSVLTFEILRDANGVNQGGLYTHQVAGGVWSTVPSASISVWKLT